MQNIFDIVKCILNISNKLVINFVHYCLIAIDKEVMENVIFFCYFNGVVYWCCHKLFFQHCEGRLECIFPRCVIELECDKFSLRHIDNVFVVKQTYVLIFVRDTIT